MFFFLNHRHFRSYLVILISIIGEGGARWPPLICTKNISGHSWLLVSVFVSDHLVCQFLWWYKMLNRYFEYMEEKSGFFHFFQKVAILPHVWGKMTTTFLCVSVSALQATVFVIGCWFLAWDMLKSIPKNAFFCFLKFWNLLTYGYF